KRCLAGWVTINNLRAFTLFDSGSTADAISPDFAKVAKISYRRLDNPVTLQLGTKGSKSRINFGCVARYSIKSKAETINDKCYFDIANVDRYDCVFGTVMMRRHGISLDFENDVIKIRGSVVPTLNEGEVS
ncbi:hypothetical protein L218DRAFT_797240, partial [Marasmius fiardii PR-910]